MLRDFIGNWKSSLRFIVSEITIVAKFCFSNFVGEELVYRGLTETIQFSGIYFAKYKTCINFCNISQDF